MGDVPAHSGTTNLNGLAVGKLGIAGGSGVIRVPARAVFWQGTRLNAGPVSLLRRSQLNTTA
jgi:hypothetical protein